MRRFDLRHPSTRRLRTWLETGQPDGVAEHVEHCDHCADRLEHLDREAPVRFDLDRASPLRAAITTAFAPPDDLGERIKQSVARRSRADEELQLLAGLFSIGFETARLMIDAGPDQDRPHHSSQNGDADASTGEEEEPT